MFLVLAALVVGYWIDGLLGAAVGACLVLVLAVWTYLSTPREHRETPHDTQMRTNQAYREAHWHNALDSGRRPLQDDD